MSENGSNASVDSGALLNTLLSNPDLIRNISSILGTGGTGTTAEPTSPSPSPSAPPPVNESAVADGISRVLANPEMMAKLPQVMSMLAPMMQQAKPTEQESSVPASAALSPSHGGKEYDRRNCRNDLLLALKPFLSPERCRAVDMLLGLSRLGDVLQKMM